MKSNNKNLVLPYLSYLSSAKKSKKPTAYSFKPIAFLGNMTHFILPNTYLSYLFHLGRSVSSGKWQVSTPMPMNKGFGKLGNIFYKKQFKKNIATFSLLFLFLSMVSCSTIIPHDNAISEQQEDNAQNYELQNAQLLELIDDLNKNENTE